MRKRISTIMLSVMTVSMCTVLLASCGKTTVASLSEQKAAASEVVELPALQLAESIAPEVSTDVEFASEQIAEELMSHVWAGSLGDEHYSIVFDSDNYARHTLTDSDGEWQGGGMHSWGLEGNKITLFWEDGELTAEYSKGNDNASLVFQDDHGNVGLTLTPTEK